MTTVVFAFKQWLVLLLLLILPWSIFSANANVTQLQKQLPHQLQLQQQGSVWTTITHDDFYSEQGLGSFVLGKMSTTSSATASASATIRANHQHEDNGYSVLVHDQSYDVSHYNLLRVSFWYSYKLTRENTTAATTTATTGNNSNNNNHDDFSFVLEYSSNGASSWEIVEQYLQHVDFQANNKEAYSTVTFGSANGFVLNHQAQLRFRCIVMDHDDDDSTDDDNHILYLNDIRFEGLKEQDLPQQQQITTKTTDHRQLLTAEDICPIQRRYPPEKFTISPFVDTNPNDAVEDDLNEISYIAYSTQTDSNGHRYAYMASDKEQYSLKVVQFTHNIFNDNTHFHGTGTTVAVYTLFSQEPLNSDWEDISLGPCTDTDTEFYTQDQICIYIGDIGNNLRSPKPQRKELFVYKFVEPIFGLSGPQSQSVEFATLGFRYGDGFDQAVDKFYDSEALFVDWTGVVTGNPQENPGDLYIVTKTGCSGGVGKIPVSVHKNVGPNMATSNYNMLRVVDDPPKQGPITCGDGPFRAWSGADMRRDGRLIAMIREGPPAAVFFYARLPQQTIADALNLSSCGYVASTSVGLPNEKKYEGVAFADPQGLKFADISECESASCSPTLYQYELEYSDSNFPPTVQEPNDGWVTITADNFESGWGSYESGGVHAVLSNEADSQGADTCNGNCACQGLWAARLQEDRGSLSSFSHAQSYPCDAYAFLRITFQFKFRGYDLLDTLFLEVSLDGGSTYFILGDWAHSVLEYPDYAETALDNAICYSASVLLTPDQFRTSSFGDQVQLRFRNSGNAANDRVYVDTITWEGNPGPTTMITPEPSAAPSKAPSVKPSAAPSVSPSTEPSAGPTKANAGPSGPSVEPSEAPTRAPSMDPSAVPSVMPSEAPSANPSVSPTSKYACCTNERSGDYPGRVRCAKPGRRNTCDLCIVCTEVFRT